MKNDNLNNSYELHMLQWDTDFFGISCAKTTLFKELSLNEWNYLKEKMKDYQFISIENRNSEPSNAQMIGRDTNAYIADVNIQFKKHLHNTCEIPCEIKIYNNMDINMKILEISDFKYSKFIEDPNFLVRGGKDVYRQWLINSFGSRDKYFAISKDINDEVNGYLLHSYSENSCIIELIAISRSSIKSGIGTRLLRAIEHEALHYGIGEIRVGTQMRNIGAINFYNKNGYKQVGCHQIYHLWNC